MLTLMLNALPPVPAGSLGLGRPMLLKPCWQTLVVLVIGFIALCGVTHLVGFFHGWLSLIVVSQRGRVQRGGTRGGRGYQSTRP